MHVRKSFMISHTHFHALESLKGRFLCSFNQHNQMLFSSLQGDIKEISIVLCALSYFLLCYFLSRFLIILRIIYAAAILRNLY